ncbi:MAG: hypothetical protein RL607_1169 [Bacteroidota bacterium]|jgi:endonuclease I
MNKFFTLLASFAIGILSAQNGAPANPYYNGFNWTLTGMNLKDALATKITTTHTNELTYTPGVWNAIKAVDLDPTNTTNVLLVYGWEAGSDADVTNDRTRDKNANSGTNGDWNREHIYAQSLGTPDLGQLGPGADAHMLRACDVQRNATRGNRLYASGSGAASYTIGSNNWYPGDEWKGDIARIIMYMYLHYGAQCLPTGVAVGSPVASDSNMIDLLLQWNAEDPVSQNEDNRNTYMNNTNNTYAQGNRNPFIDNPYLATRIWGGPVAQNRWPNIFLANDQFDTTDVGIFPNPSNTHSVYVQTNTAIDRIGVYTINGQEVLHFEHPSFANEQLQIENIPSGFYFFKLESGNESVTQKVIIN